MQSGGGVQHGGCGGHGRNIVPGPPSSSASPSSSSSAVSTPQLGFDPMQQQQQRQNGEKTLPNELIQAIAPPPLESQTQQSTTHAINMKSQSQPDDQMRQLESNDKDLQAAAFTSGMSNVKREGHEENTSTTNGQGTTSTQKETSPVLVAKQEQEVELGVQKASNVNDGPIDKGKSIISEPVTVPETESVQSRRPLQTESSPRPGSKNVGVTFPRGRKRKKLGEQYASLKKQTMPTVPVHPCEWTPPASPRSNPTSPRGAVNMEGFSHREMEKMKR
ncbi:hypothetical protein SSX86_027258 [Deinandra increscens subsp. villosa]|uniref:Uncharacterized protein n=1 Tax=Deinandra increscens subsp. villosa TaxID=3103831 RepID=A0AAP0CMY2_9ASTR